MLYFTAAVRYPVMIGATQTQKKKAVPPGNCKANLHSYQEKMSRDGSTGEQRS